MEDTQQKTNNLIVPMAIIVSGILIAGAVFFGGRGNASNAQPTQAAPQQTGSTDNVNSLTKEDHVRGNPDAPVKIIEYSDFECPFCKRFHTTIQQILDEYGKDGQVAWVYRHFPLDQLHPVKARLEAITSECVAELAGNDAFWQFTDKFFSVTPSNNRTDVDIVLPKIIDELGISQSAMDECVTSGKYDQHIQSDTDNAIATGGRGTPWSIVVGPDGKTFPISGAQPYQAVKQLVDIALRAQ